MLWLVLPGEKRVLPLRRLDLRWLVLPLWDNRFLVRAVVCFSEPAVRFGGVCDVRATFDLRKALVRTVN